MGSYRELRVWQHAVEMADMLYTMTELWPKSELYGMTNQARRAAVSVAANIAEGKGRVADKPFRHHLLIAAGSLCEVETIVYLATKRSYCRAEDERLFLEKSGEVGRTLNGLIKSLDTKIAKVSHLWTE